MILTDELCDKLCAAVTPMLFPDMSGRAGRVGPVCILSALVQLRFCILTIPNAQLPLQQKSNADMTIFCSRQSASLHAGAFFTLPVLKS